MTPSQKPRHTAQRPDYTLKIEPNEITEVVLYFGDRKITIPTPPIKRRSHEPIEALAAALIGLAIKCGIEPEENK